MTVLKEFAVAVVGVVALIAACDAVFGVGNARFDDDYYRASFYAPRATQANKIEISEARIADDITPAARVSDAFAQFTPGEAKSSRRYSSLTTIVR